MTKQVPPAHLTSGRGIARFSFVFGAALSVAVNIARTWYPSDAVLAEWLLTHPNDRAVDYLPPVGQVVWGAAVPLVLLLAVEVLTRVAWLDGRMWLLARYGGVGLVGLAAGVISYLHGHHLMIEWGESQAAAVMGPLLLDGLMLVSGFALLGISIRVAEWELAGAPAQQRGPAEAGPDEVLVGAPAVESGPGAPVTEAGPGGAPVEAGPVESGPGAPVEPGPAEVLVGAPLVESGPGAPAAVDEDQAHAEAPIEVPVEAPVEAAAARVPDESPAEQTQPMARLTVAVDENDPVLLDLVEHGLSIAAELLGQGEKLTRESLVAGLRARRVTVPKKYRNAVLPRVRARLDAAVAA